MSQAQEAKPRPKFVRFVEVDGQKVHVVWCRPCAVMFMPDAKGSEHDALLRHKIDVHKTRLRRLAGVRVVYCTKCDPPMAFYSKKAKRAHMKQHPIESKESKVDAREEWNQRKFEDLGYEP